MTLGQQPYGNIDAFEMLNFLKQGHRISQPVNCPDELFTVIACCWALSEDERPGFGQMIVCLTDFLNALSNFIWKNKSVGNRLEVKKTSCQGVLMLLTSKDKLQAGITLILRVRSDRSVKDIPPRKILTPYWMFGNSYSAKNMLENMRGP